LVDDLREFIDWHCLETPLVCGVSFGGLLALEFAARFPHRLGRLIVQGVGARFERGPIQQIASTVLSRFPLPTDSPFINQFFNLLFGGPQEDSPLFRFVTRQSWQTDQGVIAQRFRLAEQFAISDRVASIRVPTLILAGTRDVLVSKRTLKELNAGIDNSRVALLPGCGHLSFVSHPAFVGEHVRRFAPR
jgi:3-oxoadipate enol-lactonase/4-carboxymuconolactone decarboxylase